jgi:protein KTI12
MPCLILTGYPSSGKSTLAELFRERALLLFSRNDRVDNNDNNNHSDNSNNYKKAAKKKSVIEHVVIVTEATACPDQTTRACYSDSQAEKATRSALKAVFDRAVGAAAAASTSSGIDDDDKTTLIILDSMNYIKGFRYEMHCISKAAQERHAVVWVMNDVDVSKQWNEQRKQQQQQQNEDFYYTNEQMEELILRYEPPDARNRWDKPLYRVDMRPTLSSQQTQEDASTSSTPGDSSNSNDQQQQQQGLAKETLERSVYNMHDLSEAIHLQQETTIHVVAPPNKKTTTTSMGGFKRASNNKASRSNQNSNDNANTNRDSPADSKDESANNTKAAIDTNNNSMENETSLPSGSSTSKVLSLEERVDAILDSFLNHVQPLQQSFSTREQLASSDANVLQKVDMLTQQVCQAIVTAQQNAQQQQQTSGSDVAGKEKLAIHLQQQQQQEEQPLWLNCHRSSPLSWTELQRLRQQYMHWVKAQPPRDTSQRGIAQSFLQYIEASAQQ